MAFVRTPARVCLLHLYVHKSCLPTAMGMQWTEP